MSQRTYANQFTGFTLPAGVRKMLADGTLTDTSWGNDICPSFEARTEVGSFRLWVDFQNPADRECGGPHFRISRMCWIDGQWDEAEEMLATEDERLAVAFILARIG